MGRIYSTNNGFALQGNFLYIFYIQFLPGVVQTQLGFEFCCLNRYIVWVKNLHKIQKKKILTSNPLTKEKALAATLDVVKLPEPMVYF